MESGYTEIRNRDSLFLSLFLSVFVALCKVSWGRGLVVMVWLSLCYSCTDLRLCFIDLYSIYALKVLQKLLSILCGVCFRFSLAFFRFLLPVSRLRNRILFKLHSAVCSVYSVYISVVYIVYSTRVCVYLYLK